MNKKELLKERFKHEIVILTGNLENSYKRYEFITLK